MCAGRIVRTRSAGAHLGNVGGYRKEETQRIWARTGGLALLEVREALRAVRNSLFRSFVEAKPFV